MELLTYLGKVSACMAAFYIVYYVLFRKLTFFSLNRWYLLAAMVISLIIPLLHIGVQTLIPAPDVKPMVINSQTKDILEADIPIIMHQTGTPIDWTSIAVYCYLAIATLLLLKLAATVFIILHKGIKHGEQSDGYTMVKQVTQNNSSFFNYIFLADNNLSPHEKEQVIAHELVHVQLLHSADNLFAGMLKAIFWFNPFSYLFAKALCQSHEFEVDRSLAGRYNSKSYAGLLLKLSSPGAAGLSNQFSAYGLKDRIAMLFQSPSAAVKKLSYLLALPVVAALVYFLAVQKVYAYDMNSQKFTLVLDAGHGGKQGGGVALNGVAEKDFNLQLVKVIKAVAEQRGIHVILTRSDDSFKSFAERLAPKGDLFVSIHANAVSGTNKADFNGISLLTSRKNKNFPESQKLAHNIIDEMKQLQGINTTGDVMEQGVYVLRENTVPSVLLEAGYLTNKNDLAFIQNKQNQQAIAEKLVDAIMDYRKSAQPNVSGAVAAPADNSANPAKVMASAPAQNTAKADTTKKAKAKKANVLADTTKTAASPTKATNSWNDGAQGALKYTALDSTLYDAANHTLYLYRGTLNSGRFNVKADYLKLSMRDSILYANGNVVLRVSDPNKINPDKVTTSLSELTLDLKVRRK